MSTKKYRDAHKEEAKTYNKHYMELHPHIHKEYRENNREKINKNAQSPRGRFTSSKARAKYKNKEWTLTFEEFSIFLLQSCYYCNGFFGAESKYSSGLDRLDNTKGYIMGNVVTCCTVCNRARSDHFTPEETMIAIKAVISFREGK